MFLNQTFPATVLLLCASGVMAQSRSAEVVRPEVPVRINAAEVYADLVVVKFSEGHAVRLRRDGLVSETLDISSALELIAGCKVDRMFTRQVSEIDQERSALMASTGWHLADLNNYYFVRTEGAQASESLIQNLLMDPAIETAYAEPIPVMTGDIAPPTPDFESRQTYMATAPGGHGHWLTRSIDGAQGLPGQIVAQLEGAWILGHEDAEELVTANIIGTTNFGSYNTSSWYRHGTACFGIINGTRNNYGVRGFAPVSQGRVSSLANGGASMINLCTAVARAGDVFTSSFAYSSGGKHIPLDNPQANFDAVKIAAAKGICYAFSAGNSGTDIATLSSRYAASAPGSGGFIIGGTNGSNTTRAGGSNWGVKVVANGWYSSVATLGYGGLFYPGSDLKQSYTSTFGGTSAAAPQVAGVIASIQGAAKRQNGASLTVAEIRTLLETHGTSISGSENIGKRPDLWKIMNATGALDGLLITQEASVGGQISIDLSVAAGRSYMMLGSLGRSVLDIGLNRRILLDFTTAFTFLTGTMGSSGQLTLQFNVPNDATLRGKSLFMQAFDFSSVDQHLTNSVDGYIK